MKKTYFHTLIIWPYRTLQGGKELDEFVKMELNGDEWDEL